MDDLGIEFISVFGLPPVAFVELAAELGCRHITTGLQPIDYNPHGYPKFSLRDDAALRRDLLAVMRARGVSLSLGEGFVIFPHTDVLRDYAGDLGLMAELGVPRINALSVETDLARAFDQLGTLAEMAANVGLETVLEFVPTFGIANLATALAALRHVGRRDLRLVIDTMHVARSGATAAELAAVDPALIGYVQLCDAPRTPTIPDYLEEAMYERMVPGSGGLPLRDILAALPRDRVIGIEVPRRTEAEAGIGPAARLRRCVDATRRLLAQMPRSIDL